ncbi:hypothetical protein [Pelagibacterium mangrovi]|uniref:hypothetical protein n=1 Tax=Pelagibacterium mangrovi TaxID=3119828 RepID=UPI002FC9513A
MSKRSLLSDEDLKRGAETIAADVNLPDGRVLKLARVIDGGHLEWFEKARRRGLEWSDIVDVLFKAGVARSDGRPLSRGHVSSLVWRKQQALRVRNPPQVVRSSPPSRNAGRVGSDQELEEDMIAQPAVEAEHGFGSSRGPQQSKSNKQVPRSRAKASEDISDRNAIKTYVRRAAKLRQNE